MGFKNTISRAIICYILTLKLVGAYPELPIRGRSFALTTTLTAICEDGDSFKYEIDEAYSEAQGRSKISYTTIGDKTRWQIGNKIPQTGTFYADDMQVLLVDRETLTCSKSSPEQMATLFDLNPLDMENKPGQEQMFISGPARILFFLDRHRQQIVETKETDLMVRNTPCKMYTLDVDQVHLGTVRFQIFYKAENSKNLLQVPLEVIMEVKNDMYVVYDFLNVENLAVAQIEGLEKDSADDSRAQFDRFAIEPGVGCGQHMDPSHVELMDFEGLELSSFSFRSQASKPKAGDKMDMIVAYESSIASLRIDRISTAMTTTTLTNYYLGRTYHIIDTQREASSQTKQIIEQNNQAQEQLACVVVENQPMNQKEPFNMGELLLGATKLMYLGQARVRGIDVRAYEAHDATWPIWFRQPMVYHRGNLAQTNDEKLIRPTKQGIEMPLNVVVYTSINEDEKQSSEGKVGAGKIVQIDLCWFGSLSSGKRKDIKSSYCFPELTLALFDFTWGQVNVHSATGMKAENYFSLVDLCPASEVDDNHYGRVDMLALGVKEANQQLDWFDNVPERNFAYLDMIQRHFVLPITMVYDLETKVFDEQEASQSSATRTIKLAASFRLAEHDHRLAKLTFLGMGTSKVKYTVGPGLQTSYLTFQGCAFLAAHRKTMTHFAFLPASGRCILDARPDNDDLSTSKYAPIAFGLEFGGLLEIYRVSHEEFKTLGSYDRLTRLARGPDRLSFLNDFKKSTFRLWQRGSHEAIEFKMKSLDVSELNQKSSYQLEDEHLPDTNKFIGFGLVASDKGNKRVLADPLTSNNWQLSKLLPEATEMQSDVTFAQCRSACMQDFDCKSFSICIKGSEVECILSTVSFRDPLLVLQIISSKEAKNNRANPNPTPMETIQLNLNENNKIQLRRHPNCELHNKIYLDLFTEPSRLKLLLRHHLFHPVSGREQCAELCTNHTLTLLKKDTDQSSRQVLSDIVDDPSKDPEIIQEAIDNHRNLFSNICKVFMYLDKSRLEMYDKEVKERVMSQLIATRVDGYTDGFCVIGDEFDYVELKARDGAANSASLSEHNVAIDRYNFKFESFYERQLGVRLKESAEAQTLARNNWLNSKNYLTKSEQYLIKPYVSKGFNSLVFSYHDVQACSLMCFTQSIGLEPACKSFDIIIKRAYQQVTICQLNTITLRDAVRGERFELIDDNPSPDVQVWHYDPLPGFVLQEVEQQSHYWLANFNSLLRLNSLALRLGPWTILLAIVVALAAGVVLGVNLGSRYLIRTAPNRPVDEQTSELVDSTPTVEFSNLVNFEGKISGTEEQ